MLWIVTVVTALAGIVALVAVMLVKRSAHDDELGSVSSHWIAEHHVDSR